MVALAPKTLGINPPSSMERVPEDASAVQQATSLLEHYHIAAPEKEKGDKAMKEVLNDTGLLEDTHGAGPEEEKEDKAVERVLNTTELIEEILLLLDNKTLLFSQSVNKRFKSVIEGSTPLQQKLFFKQAPPPYHGTINPLFKNDVYSLQSPYFHDSKGYVNYSIDIDAASRPDGPAPPGSWRRMYFKHGPMVPQGGDDKFRLHMGYGLGFRHNETITIPSRVPTLTLGEYEQIMVDRFKEVYPQLCEAERDRAAFDISSAWDPEAKIVRELERRWRPACLPWPSRT